MFVVNIFELSDDFIAFRDLRLLSIIKHNLYRLLLFPSFHRNSLNVDLYLPIAYKRFSSIAETKVVALLSSDSVITGILLD